MTTRRWTNASVMGLAGEGDPLAAVVTRARQLVSKALDDGWAGPPFDPFALADLLGMKLSANTSLRDARLVMVDGVPCVEFNPDRPRGRVRYSVAHEIAHTLFPDWHEAVRNRVETGTALATDSELEVLCNVGAAEILMPFGTVSDLRHEDVSIDRLIALQRELDVSTEALFIRVVQVSERPCAMLVARATDGSRWEVEYSISSANSDFRAFRGDSVDPNSVITHLRGIGHTQKSGERWAGSGADLRIEAIGIPGHPGSPYPRVVAWIRTHENEDDVASEWITYILGDATDPSAPGSKMIVQVVSDGALTWGGGGFAAAVRRRYPKANESFREWIMQVGGAKLGRVHFVNVAEDRMVASIIAQRGYGPSTTPRIRYEPLLDGLRQVAERARTEGASLHMPRIGAGMAGGSWERIEELLAIAFRDAGLKVTVYNLPDARRR